MARKKNVQKAESLPLVAIELGSHSVRAMAAERIDSDLIKILAVEENAKDNCVQSGIITNTANAAFQIAETLHLLANRLQIPKEQLNSAFVTVGGKSVQAISVFSKRDQIRRREISDSMLTDMKQECKLKIESHNPGAAVIGLIPCYYVLDNEEQDTPPTPMQRATLVEVHYTAFVGRKELESQLQKSFDQAYKTIESTFVRQDALLSVFACEDGEDILQQGCAVLDLGAQTTTLTVFKGTSYLFHKVVPQGGYNITRVIEQQGINFKTAETLKTKYGYASAAQVKKNLKMRIPACEEVGGELVLTSEELAYMIQVKLEEIVGPLMVALQQFSERLSRLYITGGGAMLQGIDNYLQQKTNLRVVYGAHDALLTTDTDEHYYEPQFSALVGALIMGADYREQHKDEPVKEPDNMIGKVKKSMIDLFANNEVES